VTDVGDSRSKPTSVPEESIGFPGGPDVDVREVDDRHWSVLRPFEYQAERERYTVPKGERTDFASVPRPLVWFIPTYGRYTKAAILHDYLCRLVREGKFDRRDADGIFRQAMRSSGVPFLRRWIMWAGVRWGALITSQGRQGWLKDAWQVLLITVVVLPILLPAASVIVLTLLVWHLAEWAIWLPLAAAGRARAKYGKPGKRVNQPTLTFRL